MTRKAFDQPTLPRNIFLAGLICLILLNGCWQEDTDRLESRRNLARWEDARLAPRDSLVALLKGGDAHIRLAAVRTAGLIGRTDILPEMIAALDDPSDTIRRQAAFSLGLLGDERAIAALTEAYDSPRPSVREAALAGLGQLPNDGQTLLAAAASTNPTEAALAWNGLRNVTAGVDSSALREAVLAGLARPETDVQWRVLRCLERFQATDLVPLVAPLAGSMNHQVRVHAYRALGQRETYPAFVAVMDGWAGHDRFRDRHLARVQISALRALGRLAPTIDTAGLSTSTAAAAWNDLAAVLIIGAGSGNPHVAETALVAMSGVVREAPLPPEAADQESLLPVWRIRLARAARSHLDDEPLGVKVAAVGAWADLRGSGAGDELTDRLEEAETPQVQAALLRAISQVNPEPLAVLARFADPSHGALVRAAALTGLDHVRDRQPQAMAAPGSGDVILNLVISASTDSDFVVATTAANLLGGYPSDAGLTARCDLWDGWDHLTGPDRFDVQLGVLAGWRAMFPPVDKPESVIAWESPDSLRSRAAELLRRAFDSSDIRIRLEARETALASRLLPERLIPEAASLRATLPVFERHPDQPPVAVPGPAPRVRCVTDRGDFVIQLNGDLAPNTCALILDLINRGYYEDLTFHRVVPDFVVQGGDPRGDGWGGPGYTIRSEWSDAPYRRTTVGIAHSGKDTGGSQFFVTLSEQPHLNGRYTVFGEVVKGMDVVDRVEIGDRFGLEVIRK